MAVKQAQKFTEEELTTLRTIQSKSQNATLKFGQLYLNKIRLEEQETILKSHVKGLEQEEAEIAKQLSDKYGKGSIDIETGEFTPTE
jgi:hypothetical protein|tara:strand:- start:8 stop:268 length:261 start_codon:yes stop_codon:yes gene_type:complete